MTEKTNISVMCHLCGSKEFKLPPDPMPEDKFECIGCGKMLKYATAKDIRGQKARYFLRVTLWDWLDKSSEF